MRAGYEAAAGHAPLSAMPSTAPCKPYRARVRRMALSTGSFDFLDCTARHSADLRVRYLRAADRTRWVQWAVTRAFFAVRSVGTVVDCQRLIRPQPHSRHSSQHPASSWVSARRSSILRAAQLHIRISFCGPHSELSELPVSSYSLVHRDRHSRPARAPVHAPAHLPSHVRVADHADPGAV